MMGDDAFQRAVDALAAATRGGPRTASLPLGSQPANLAEAHRMQDALVRALGEEVAGWKVAGSPNGVMRGAILRSRVRPSPAALPSAGQPLLGVEAEIAFRLRRDLPTRDSDYTAEEVAEASVALVAIEIVGTRFESYDAAPALDRSADCMSNLAFIPGTERQDWRAHDLSRLEAVVRVNGEVAIRRTGSHVTGDPLHPAVWLANALRHGPGLRAGQFVTTGTFTGLHRAAPGDMVEVLFEGFGTASVVLAP